MNQLDDGSWKPLRKNNFGNATDFQTLQVWDGAKTAIDTDDAIIRNSSNDVNCNHLVYQTPNVIFLSFLFRLDGIIKFVIQTSK